MERRAGEPGVREGGEDATRPVREGRNGSAWSVPGVLREALALIAVTREQALAYLLLGVAASAVSFGEAAGDDLVALMTNAAEELLWFLAVALVHFWLLCGMVRVAIDAARTSRGGSLPAAVLQSRQSALDPGREDGAGAWRLFRVSFADYTEAGIVAGVQLLGVALGMLCFLFPGLYFALGWSMALYAVLDQRARWLKSLAYSRTLTRGSMGRLLLLALALIAAGIPGTLLTAQASLPDLAEMPDFGLVVEAASPGIAAASVGLSPPLAGLVGSVLTGIAGLLWIYAGAVVYVNLEEAHSSASPDR